VNNLTRLTGNAVSKNVKRYRLTVGGMRIIEIESLQKAKTFSHKDGTATKILFTFVAVPLSWEENLFGCPACGIRAGEWRG
jgi:hypothetical protein